MEILVKATEKEELDFMEKLGVGKDSTETVRETSH